MGECELCGAVKVGVRQVPMGKTTVSACSRCVEKMNLGPKKEAPGLARARNMRAAPRRASSTALMASGPKELAEDFHKRIASARTAQNLSQQQLAKKMAETVNVVKSAEAGKRPTDAVVRKFERILSIELMVARSAEETRHVTSGPQRGMTFGDYLNNLE
jgi:uncharacterized protein (TIGR00270 family)